MGRKNKRQTSYEHSKILQQNTIVREGTTIQSEHLRTDIHPERRKRLQNV